MAILFNAVLAYIFLREIPSVRTVVGGTMVIIASLALFFFKQHTLRQAEQGESEA